MLPDDPRYLSVTSEFLQGLGGSLPKWTPPWAMCLDDEYSHGGWPHRGNGSAFRGDNLAPLRAAAREHGHEYPTWLVEAEVLARGGAVEKGARGVVVRVAVGGGGVAIDAGTEEAGSIDASRFRDHVVYNVSQISDLPASYYREAWQLMPRNRENRIARVEGFFRDLGVRVVHGVDREEGALPRLEIGARRIHMPPWQLFNSARDYYVTLAHEAVHWARDERGHFDESMLDDKVRVAREDLIAEVGAAFLCADLAFSNAPLGDQVRYVDSVRKTLGDPRLAVLDLAGEAEVSVRWLHQRAPGYRAAEGALYRRVPPVSESPQGRTLDMAGAARRFVAETQELRGQYSDRNSAWITEAVRLLDEANRIDLSVGEVSNAIEAAVILSRGWVAGGLSGPHEYMEGVRGGLRRDIEQAVVALRRHGERSGPVAGIRL